MIGARTQFRVERNRLRLFLFLSRHLCARRVHNLRASPRGSAMRFLAKSLLVLGLLAAAPALAQQEPPARVGRVAVVNGELGFHGAGETAWSKASLNYPVATGESFWTDPKSRAELRIGSRSIAMNGNTEMAVAKLDRQVMQLALKQGRINLRVRTLLESESIEVDLPKGAVWILEPGIYDIDAGGGDQPERVAVFEGSARFVGGSLDVAVKAGDRAVISGAQTLTAAVEKASQDDFTAWCRSTITTSAASHRPITSRRRCPG